MAAAAATTDNYQQFGDGKDGATLWHTALSGVSRVRGWLFPALTAAAVLILIIALGASNATMSSRLSTMEESVSNLKNHVQSLNSSLQQAHVSQVVKQLAGLDSLGKTVAGLKCAVDRILTNGSGQDSCCPLGWRVSRSSCYYFSPSSLTWNASRDWCERQDAHLVILHADLDWDFVTRNTMPEEFWVGLSDSRTGRWEWVNQTPYEMERRRWNPGQPDSWTGHGRGGDEDCAHLHGNGRLNDRHCSFQLRFVCQKHTLRP